MNKSCANCDLSIKASRHGDRYNCTRNGRKRAGNASCKHWTQSNPPEKKVEKVS